MVRGSNKKDETLRTQISAHIWRPKTPQVNNEKYRYGAERETLAG